MRDWQDTAAQNWVKNSAQSEVGLKMGSLPQAKEAQIIQNQECGLG